MIDFEKIGYVNMSRALKCELCEVIISRTIISSPTLSKHFKDVFVPPSVKGAMEFSKRKMGFK